jgi:hypothetical protein
MRRISSRWLLGAGLLVAMGGCRHVESPSSGEPAASAPIAPEAGWQPMPSIPLEAAVPVATPKQVAKRPAPKQEPVQQVEYRAAVPNLGHAPDHSWLVGRLERDEAKDRWFVRYADPGERETFGGRLELVRTGSMAGFQVGQTVRAEGKLVDPAPYETRPAYSILSLQAIRE